MPRRSRFIDLCTIALACTGLLWPCTADAAAAAAAAAGSSPLTQLLAWIHEAGLPRHYSELLQRPDWSDLSSVTDQRLQEAGVPLGHRKKILKQLRSMQPIALPSQCDDDDAENNADAQCSAALPSASPTRSGMRLPRGVEDPGVEHVGGWASEPHGHAFDTDRCTIEIRTTDLTREEFMRDFYLKKPVLLVPNAQRSAAVRRTRAHWTKAHLLAEHGHFDVTLGTPQQLTAFGAGKLHMTLREYIEDLSRVAEASAHAAAAVAAPATAKLDASTTSSSAVASLSSNRSSLSISRTHYLFDRNTFLLQSRELLSSYSAPALFDEEQSEGLYTSTFTFALGPTGTGINFHYHKDGWNEVLFGRKRWLIYSPAVGTPPGGYNQFESAAEWFRTTYAKLKPEQMPLECVQYAGETLYIPEDWYHATINLGETIAVAGQSRNPAEGTLMHKVTEGLALAGSDPHRVESLYRAALEQYPGFSQVYNLLGNLFRNLDPARAIAEYTEATRFNPLYAMAWASLGGLQLAARQYEAALHSYTKAQELSHDYYDALLGLGNALTMTNDLHAAAPVLQRSVDVALQQAVTASTDLSGAQASFVNLAVIYNSLGRYDESLAVARKWLSRFPADMLMQLSMADTLRRQGQLAEAIALYRDIAANAPEQAHRDIARNELEDALADMEEQAASSKPKRLPSHSADESKPSPAPAPAAGHRTVGGDRAYFTRVDAGGLPVKFDKHSIKTLSALKRWRAEMLERFVNEELAVASAASQSSAPTVAPPTLSVYQIYHSAESFAQLTNGVPGLKCFSTAPSIPKAAAVPSDGCLKASEIVPSFGEPQLALMLGEQAAVLSLGAVLSKLHPAAAEWVGFTSYHECSKMLRETCFGQLLSRRSEPAFLEELLSLPYSSALAGQGIERTLVGVDGGPHSARLPEHQLWTQLEEDHPGAKALLLRVLRAMDLPGTQVLKALPPMPRGLAFYSNMIALSRSSFLAYWKFLVVALDALMTSVLPLPAPGRSLSYLLQRLPMLWAIHSGRACLYVQTMEYVHDDFARGNPPLLDDAAVDAAFDKMIAREVAPKLRQQYDEMRKRDQQRKPTAVPSPAAAAPPAPASVPTPPVVDADDPSPFLSRLSLPLSFPASPLRLTMEGSFDLAVLYPSMIRELRAPEVLDLVTSPFPLSDPATPHFTGSSSRRSERADFCRDYLGTRVGHMAFQVGTVNTWMEATEGRLYGRSSVFEIVGETVRAGSRTHHRGIVVLGWDGLVSTGSRLFTFEKRCVSGLFCLVDELRQLGLLNVTSTTGNSNPALRGELRAGRPLGLEVQAASPLVFSGAAMLVKAARATDAQRKFSLGIQSDHLLRSFQTFAKQLLLVPSPPAPRSPGRIVPASEHGFPAVDLSLPSTVEFQTNLQCASVEVHHYPALCTVEQYMSTVNYAHWLNEVGPKILQMKPMLLRRPSLRLVVQPNSWTLGWMDVAGIPRESIVFAHPCILHTADRIYVATPQPLDAPALQTVALTRTMLMRHPAPPVAPSSLLPSVYEARIAPSAAVIAEKSSILSGAAGPYIVSMFRPPPVPRSITNAEAVEASIAKAFPKLKIARFDSADYTLNETITLFNGASAIIGVSGAGFANLVFASPPTVALQLIPAITHVRLPCGLTPWWHLSEVCGVSMRSLVVEDASFSGAPFAVPIKDFDKFLAKVKVQAVTRK